MPSKLRDSRSDDVLRYQNLLGTTPEKSSIFASMKTVKGSDYLADLRQRREAEIEAILGEGNSMQDLMRKYITGLSFFLLISFF